MMIARLSDPYPYTDWTGLKRQREVDAAVREGLSRAEKADGAPYYLPYLAQGGLLGPSPRLHAFIAAAWREQHA